MSVTGSATKCDTKSKDVNLADIYVGGRANIALMTSCIAIDGTNSTYDFQDAGLFGVDVTLGKVWG